MISNSIPEVLRFGSPELMREDIRMPTKEDMSAVKMYNMQRTRLTLMPDRRAVSLLPPIA